MTTLTNIKQKLANYDWMTFSCYLELKKEILALDVNTICKIYQIMDADEEIENERYYTLVESESELSDFYSRTKYFYKILNTVSEIAFAEYEKEMNKPIGQQLAESSDSIILKMNEYEIGTFMSLDVKNLVNNEITKRGL